MTEFEALRIAEYSDRETFERVEGRYWLQKRCYEGPGDCPRVVRADAEALHFQARLEREASLAAIQAAIGPSATGAGARPSYSCPRAFPTTRARKVPVGS